MRLWTETLSAASVRGVTVPVAARPWRTWGALPAGAGWGAAAVAGAVPCPYAGAATSIAATATIVILCMSDFPGQICLVRFFWVGFRRNARCAGDEMNGPAAWAARIGW